MHGPLENASTYIVGTNPEAAESSLLQIASDSSAHVLA